MSLSSWREREADFALDEEDEEDDGPAGEEEDEDDEVTDTLDGIRCWRMEGAA